MCRGRGHIYTVTRGSLEDEVCTGDAKLFVPIYVLLLIEFFISPLKGQRSLTTFNI